MFRVLRPELFTPNCGSILNPYVFQGSRFVKSVQNPTKEDTLNGNYKPRLTAVNRLTEGGRQIELRIEFSAPKLLFGNNFDELAQQDFQKVVQTLNCKLKEMGVVVGLDNLARAPVSAVHYSKNVALDDFTSVSMIISELAKVDVNQRMDISESKYRNSGHCLHYHADSFEVVFYDKLKDLEQANKSPKRAIENDNYCQMNIYDEISKIKPFEVFRMEVRLGNATKIRQLFKKVGSDTKLVFNEVFNRDVSQKVLLHFWEQVDAGLSVFKMDATSPCDLLRGIKKNNPTMRPSKLLKLIGAIVLIKEVGYRPLREALGIKSRDANVWYSLKKELKSVDQLKITDKYKSILKVKDALKAFIPLRLADYDIQF
ncbi:MAG: hypothetical protein Q8P62_05480 [Candidatus Peregrinibacteria bacterium]|nr:hypothetical protein [Candidatus Peregrinibacteria bacterium]